MANSADEEKAKLFKTIRVVIVIVVVFFFLMLAMAVIPTLLITRG
jgi:uncharacterized membrane-anchored protein